MTLAVSRSCRRRSAGIFAVRYLALLAILNLGWEFAQMPLYTIGQSGSPREIVVAALHCTVGDVMIGGLALLAALVASAPANWPEQGHRRVLATALTIGLGYTVLSEWLNVDVWGSWAYAEAMPVLPGIGTGLAPVLQWLILPPLAYLVARGTSRSRAAIYRLGLDARGRAGTQTDRTTRNCTDT